MDLNLLKENLKNMDLKVDRLFDTCKISEKEENLRKLENESSKDDFYTNNPKMAEILSSIKSLNDKLKKFYVVRKMKEDAKVFLELSEEDDDKEALKEAEKLYLNLEKSVEKLEIESLLSDTYDSNNAIISIHPRSWWHRISGLG